MSPHKTLQRCFLIGLECDGKHITVDFVTTHALELQNNESKVTATNCKWQAYWDQIIIIIPYSLD